jgi:hypothetical protein
MPISIDPGSEDCATKNSPTIVSGSGSASVSYYWNSSRSSAMVDATAQAEHKARLELAAKIVMPACTPPCKPFALLTDVHVVSSTPTNTTPFWRWVGIGVLTWFEITVDVSVSGWVTTGCGS